MFKKRNVLAIIPMILISLFLLAGCGEEKKVIGVDALAADPLAFKGEIEVKGVVQQVDQETFSLVLIDEEEYKTCGLYPCAGAGKLPIYVPDASKPDGPTPSNYVYSGSLPKLEETVTAIGNIHEVEGGLFFEVEKILKGSEVLIEKK